MYICSFCNKEFNTVRQYSGHKSSHSRGLSYTALRKFEPILLNEDNTLLCEYGCGAVAKFRLKNNKVCCSSSFNSCLKMKEKNSNSCKKLKRRSNLIEYNQKLKNSLFKKDYSDSNPIHYTNQYIKAKILGLPTPKISEETRLKMSKSSKGRKLSLEAKSKLSLSRSKFLEEKGSGGFLDVKWYSIKNILLEDYKVRGTWELKFAEFLNSKNILWKRKIYIRYMDNDVFRTYCPDFYIPCLNKYVEIKGYYSEKDKKKMQLVSSQNNISIIIGFESDIKNLDSFWEKIQETNVQNENQRIS